MDVIYGLIPGMTFVGVMMLVLLLWSVKKGQFDDLEGDANRILMDDDDPMLPEEFGRERDFQQEEREEEH